MVIPDLKTNFIWVYNGKYGGGDMLLSPYSIVNDGACELTYLKERVGFCQSMPFFNKVKAGGEQVYDERINTVRAKKFEINNKSDAAEDLNIDGEELSFKKKLVIECLHNEIEIVVDIEKIINTTYKTV